MSAVPTHRRILIDTVVLCATVLAVLELALCVAQAAPELTKIHLPLSAKGVHRHHQAFVFYF